MITIFQKCAKWPEKEILGDHLTIEHRKSICVKMIRIADHCIKLGNYPVGKALISGFGPNAFVPTPSSLWQEVPKKWRDKHEEIRDKFLNNPIEGYNNDRRRFSHEFFYIPSLQTTVRTFELKINCQPTYHNQYSTLIHLKKYFDLHDTIVEFLKPQILLCNLKPNHDLQWAIAWRLSDCGRVKNTGATTSERVNRAQFDKVSEQIETEAVATKLSYLGF